MTIYNNQSGKTAILNVKKYKLYEKISLKISIDDNLQDLWRMYLYHWESNLKVEVLEIFLAPAMEIQPVMQT